MSTCPIHGTPLNGGACLPCDIASGQFDANFEPGSDAEREHQALKANAIQRTNDAISQAVAALERTCDANTRPAPKDISSGISGQRENLALTSKSNVQLADSGPSGSEEKETTE